MTRVCICLALICFLVLAACSAPTPESQAPLEPEVPEPGARTQPGTGMGLYTPEQHDRYDGRFIIAGNNVHQVGTLDDESGWDHMGDDGTNVRAIGGTIEIDVNEIDNSGTFRAELELPEGTYVVNLEQFQEFSPCQDGGIAAFLFEHGDAGCGDANWPKSLLYVAGWGTGSATLNGDPLYSDYQIHFMVTQGMRDRDTLATQYPLQGKSSPAGAVNPAL